MGEYDLGKLKEVGGDGLSGLASRSDLAMARALKPYGLTLDWWNTKNVEQNSLCADCHKQEKRLGNGTHVHKKLGLGFGPDGKPNRLICQNCAARQRKVRMEEKNAPKDYASFEDFWKINCATLQQEDPLELARLRERDADIRETYNILGIYLDRHDGQPCYQLTNTLDEIEQELRDHGTVDLNVFTCKFYLADQRHIYDQIQAGAELPDAPQHVKNTATFARLGLFIALPVTTCGRNTVREFLKRYNRWPYPDWGKQPSSTMMLRCSTRGCKATLEWDLKANPIPPAQWLCQECEAKHAVVKPSRPLRPEDQLFMSGKEMKDSTSKQPAWFRAVSEG